MAASSDVPKDLALDLSRYPKLSSQQAGHLRHFYNLSSAVDGEWPHMGSQEPAQEFLDAYRYQLATMAYACGLTHYHRLPVMRSLFKTLIRRTIHKMLRREVWGYWFLTSHSGSLVDPDLKELRKPWADPIVRENIMYSGHLLLMTSLYAMLFDDDEFEKPGSLKFVWNPLFWGMGTEVFKYDNRSLQQAILREMERNDWVGVCCEPNLVFVVCNQFPIIAMHYNDVRNGTNITEGVLEKYRAAVEKRGMISKDGLYAEWLSVKRGTVTASNSIGTTAWSNAFMNTWNSEYAHSGFENQSTGFITNLDGKIELQVTAVANEIRRLEKEEGASPRSPATVKKAIQNAKADASRGFPYTQPTFGYVVKWLSELGKDTELNGLLAYADANLNPTWENGGLYYPRNDIPVDDDWKWTQMDAFTGNAAIAYSRLNVADGQKKMWDRPWTREYLDNRPWIDGLDLSQDIDCLRGVWEEAAKAIIVTLKTWNGKPAQANLIAKNLEVGTWAVYEQGKLSAIHELSKKMDIHATISVEARKETDIVILKVGNSPSKKLGGSSFKL